jgi:hypothetical protein
MMIRSPLSSLLRVLGGSPVKGVLIRNGKNVWTSIDNIYLNRIVPLNTEDGFVLLLEDSNRILKESL